MTRGTFPEKDRLEKEDIWHFSTQTLFALPNRVCLFCGRSNNCKYLDFYAVLKDRMESTSVVGGKAKEGSKQVELATRVYEDTATNTQPDGNNVDVDSQSNELAKVQLHYQALKNQMNGEFTRLRSAMKT